MLTHIVHHIFRMTRRTNFKVSIRMEDDGPHQPQAPCPPRSKVKVAKSRDQFEPSWPNTVPEHYRPSGRGHTVLAEHGGQSSCSQRECFTKTKQASIFICSINKHKDIISMNNVQGQAARKAHKAHHCWPPCKKI